MKIRKASEDEVDFLETALAEHDQKQRPILQKEKYQSFARVIKNQDGEVIAGGVAYASMYFIGYLDTLWVAEEARGLGLGAKLLASLEADLREYGCENCHLDTFDFQAPAFYQKQGYQVFGQIVHEKVGITEYFLVKKL